jgi:hypothetical protein
MTTPGSGILGTSRAYRPHVAKNRAGGVAGEVAKLRSDVTKALTVMASLVVEEYTNLAAASTNAFKLAIATATTAQTYTGTALDGATGRASLYPPRNVTVTTTGVDGNFTDNSKVHITGFDIDDKPMTEDITITLAGSPGTFAGTKTFKRITKIVVDAQAGTGGTIAVGFGTVIGLTKTGVARAGLLIPVREIVDGAVVTTGTISTAATNAPHGAYAPATAPDGAHDYAIYYEGV